jgi:hypothetical protein
LIWLVALGAGFLWGHRAPSSHAASEAPILVGRVAHIDGELLRYVPEEEDWVLTVRDSPVGAKDVLHSGRDGRAEVTFPNGTMVRLGHATQFEVTTIEDDLTDLYVGSGQVRLYSRGSRTLIRAATPFGYAVVNPGGQADMYVGDESVEVISLGGNVDFVHTRDGYESRYDLTPGSSSIIADRNVVGSGDGTVDSDWNRWNLERDNLWRKRTQVRSRYLPEPLMDDAYVLEESGRWERVYYDGGYRYFWRPTVVVSGWSPFTVGRWTTWYGEHVWVPYEPFGYVTHHYGSWVVVGGLWYWAPPVVTVSVGVPYPPVYWYPGRVAWIHSGPHIGWFPLAPHEVYYAYRPWGPQTVVVNNINITNIQINLARYAFVDRAVVVRHHDLYMVDNYAPVRITNINRTTIINNYAPAPVVHRTVISNLPEVRNRYNFVNQEVRVKPHQTVVAQIKERQRAERAVTAAALSANLQKAPKGNVVEGARIKEPQITNRLVPLSEATKPQPQFERVKPKVTPERPQVSPALGGPPKPGGERPPGWEKGRKEGWEGTQPPGLEKKAEKPGKPGAVEPARPERPKPPGGPAEAEGTVKPQKPGKPGVVEPARPERPRPPSGPAEAEGTVKPQRPGKPGAVEPARPERPRPPSGPAEAEGTVKPQKPGKPGAVEPARPERPRPPSGPAEAEGTVKPQRPGKPGAVEPARPERPKPPGEPGGGESSVRPERGTKPGRPASVEPTARPEGPPVPQRVDRPARPAGQAPSETSAGMQGPPAPTVKPRGERPAQQPPRPSEQQQQPQKVKAKKDRDKEQDQQ